MAILGNNNVEATQNGWFEDADFCKFTFSGTTGTYTGTMYCYLDSVASAPNNKMVMGIYLVSDSSKVAQTSEITGLTSSAWGSGAVTGSFTLTNSTEYWLVVHAPSGNNGRIAVGTGGTGQHGWKTDTYNSTLADPYSPDGTGDDLCSIYLDYAAVGGATAKGSTLMMMGV